jgi:hypothetical protein
MTADIKPGDFVRVCVNHSSTFAGRSGLVVAVDEDVASVRFSAKRAFPFAVKDLRPVIRPVR